MSMNDVVMSASRCVAIGVLVACSGAPVALASEAAPAFGVCEPETVSRADRRPRMLEKLFMLDAIQAAQGRALCFSPNSTPEQMQRILEQYQMLPPTIANIDPRFRTDTTVWSGSGNLGTSAQASRANLTYSFPNDGVSWDGGGNTLSANLAATFGSVDRGREFIRQGLASWRRFNGLTYTEVADDNAVFTNNTANATQRGNLRIGARPQDGVFGVLAYNYFPSDGSDMVLDANEFVSNSFGAAANNFLTFRNTIAHEHGHGLAAIHTVPCNGTKLMEPQLATGFDGVQIDDIRFAARNYGDRRAGNDSGANAFNFGNLTSPTVRSVIERNLSTNGTAGPNNTDEDWFRFTLGSTQNVVITVDPQGGSYTEGQQSSGCSGTTATRNAEAAGNLNVELRGGVNGATVLQTASSAAAGVNEVLTANNLAAGTYWVRVVDVGPNTTANQFVQLYDMTIRVGTSKAPPVAIAGLSKRIAAGTPSHFIGNINSFTTDTAGATSNPATITSYAWDLDGDGLFGGSEDSGISQTSKTYVSNGTYPITLRVTDSNGLTGTDTIDLVVFGAQASISSISPSVGAPGQVVPISISGVNFRGVTSASQVAVSGTGVTVTGTPVVNSMGTQITGLSLNISAGAPNGARNLTITNSDGSGTASGNVTATNGFLVGTPCVSPTVTQQPQPQNLCTGQTLTLTIAANGTNLVYDWRRNGVSLGAPSSPTLTLTNVNASQSGNYFCAISNPCGNASSSFVFVNILDPFTIVTQPVSQTICTGQPLTISVVLSEPAAEVQWRKDGEIIPDAISQTLFIPSASGADAGTYDAIFETGCGQASTSSAVINVQAGAPSISQQPQPAVVCPGDSAAFSVVASGAVSYQWRRNGSNLGGPNGPTLTIDPVGPGDFGNYDVVITGTCGAITSSVVSLSQGAAPSITQQPQSQASCRGQGVTLSVTASGATGFQWRRNGNNVDMATGSTLNIPLVNATTTGSYDVIVSSDCGSITSSAAQVTLCRADQSCNGVVETQDIFDYLNDFFAGNPAADVDGGGIAVGDIFAFLNLWFAGCP